jgi:hypothetical protein
LALLVAMCTEGVKRLAKPTSNIYTLKNNNALGSFI